MDDLEVRELGYFVAVAEELHFGRAAQRLGIAQPPLSRTIQRLEERLGVALLERSTRHVALTAAGTVLLEQGRAALDAVTAAGRRAQRAGKSISKLQVAVKASGDVPALRALLNAYQVSEPDLPEVEITVCGYGEPASLVRDGTADVAVLRTPFETVTLDYEPLVTEPRVAIVTAGHELAQRSDVRRADLAREPVPSWQRPVPDPAFVAYWTGVDSLPEQARFRAPVGPSVRDMDQLFEVVALGQAVAFLPASLAARRAGPEIARIPILDLSPSTVAVAWPEDCRSLAVAAFVRAASDLARREPDLAACLA